MNRFLIEFWALLICTLSILIWYSSFEKAIKWNFDLKQCEIKKIFKTNKLEATNFESDIDAFAEVDLSSGQLLDSIKETSKDSFAAIKKLGADNIAVVNFPKDAFKSYDLQPVVDSSSLYILLAGDSMTEELRHGLSAYCEKNGFKLMTCIWYSSGTELWSESNRLSNLINDYRPDLILFTLGSNELFRKDITEREQFIQDIIYEADRTKTGFVWINPPAWKDDTGISEIIKKNVGAGRYFDSRNIKMGRKSDGAHPTREGAQIWADTIVRFLKQNSHYKSLFSYFEVNLKTSKNKVYNLQKLDTVLTNRKNKLSTRILKDNYDVTYTPPNVSTLKNNVHVHNLTVPADSLTVPERNDSVPKNKNKETADSSRVLKHNKKNTKNNGKETPNKDSVPKNKNSVPINLQSVPDSNINNKR